MNSILIKDVVRATGGILTRGNEDDYITGVWHDSRECGAKDMFVAIIGEKQDGHKFIPQVVKAGCNTILVSHEEGWPEELNDMEINVIKVDDTVYAMGELAKYYLSTLDVLKIAVTGSVGKTSVRDMIYYVINEKYACGRNMKNYNNFIGLPISIFQFDDKTEVVVLEMGMDKAGEIDRLAEIVKPNIAVITNIGISHIENFGSRDGIFNAKMEITNHIEGIEDKTAGSLVFPLDQDYLTQEKTAGNYKCISIGEDKSNEYIISDIDDFGLDGIKFTLEHNGEIHNIGLNLPGQHNSINAALAIAVGNIAGVSVEEAKRGLLKVELTGSRLKRIKTDKLDIIDDTYNANPDSMKSAAKVLSLSNAKGRKVAILGDMYELGAESISGHNGVGAYIKSLNIDTLIAVGDNAKHIAEGAEGGNVKVSYYKDKESLYDDLTDYIGAGDMVLVKGSRGMAMEKIVEKLIEF